MKLNRRAMIGSSSVAVAGAMLGVSATAQTKKERPFIMDVHVHAGDGIYNDVPQKQYKKLVKEIYGPWEEVYNSEGEVRPRDTEFTPSPKALLDFLDRHGIDVAIIMPFDPNRVAARKDQRFPGSNNDSTLKYVEANPNRLVGICGHDPLKEQWKGPIELERMVKDHGFKGMKIYPPYYQFYPNDERLFPIYEKAIELDVVLTFHTGWTPLLNAPMKYGHPIYLDDVGIKFPDLKVNMAHVGGASWWRDAVLVAARHRNFTIDVSSWCTNPPWMFVEMLDLGRQLIGAERILYGSEHSLCSPREFTGELKNINKFAEVQAITPFTDEEINGMLGLNAARVYQIEPKKYAPA